MRNHLAPQSGDLLFPISIECGLLIEGFFAGVANFPSTLFKSFVECLACQLNVNVIGTVPM